MAWSEEAGAGGDVGSSIGGCVGLRNLDSDWGGLGSRLGGWCSSNLGGDTGGGEGEDSGNESWVMHCVSC